MQVLLPKSAEFSNQANSSSREEAQQQQFTQYTNKQVQQANKMVIQTSKSDEKNNINKDGRNKEEHSGKNKKKSASRYAAKADDKKNAGNAMFDVTI